VNPSAAVAGASFEHMYQKEDILTEIIYMFLNFLNTSPTVVVVCTVP
jgi:hypothetical protein